MNRLARAVVLLLGLSLAGHQILEAQAAEPELVLVELELGRIASRTVEAYRSGDAALVPLQAFFDLAEIKATRRADGAIEALLQPGNVPLDIDPATRMFRIGKEKRELAPGQLLATPTDVYVDAAVLGPAFDIEWEVSWPDLQVVVVDPSTLPIARRVRRDALARAQLAAAETPQYLGTAVPLPRSRFDGVVFDYSLLTQSTGLDGSAYSAMLGMDVLGGGLAVGLESQPDGAGPRSLVSWTGVWRDKPWLAQLQLGDGIASGPRPRSLRGFSVTNSPWQLPEYVGIIPFGGQLGAGWTVEAYRGGRFIGFDSVNALGRFSFDVPIQYGENPVDFIAYGPFGEVRQFNQTYRALGLGVPKGKLWYGASVGACRTTRCNGNGNVDLRYGVDTRWTIRAGYDAFWRDDAAALNHPYVGIVGSLGNAFQVEAEAVANATMRGLLRFMPSVDLQLQVEANRFSRGMVDPILTPQGRLDQLTFYGFYRPVAELGAWYLEASVDRIHGMSSDVVSSRIGASMQVSSLRLMPAIRLQQETMTTGGPRINSTFLSLNTFLLPLPQLGPVFGRMTARTSLDWQAGVGVASASAFLGLPITRWIRTEVGGAWYAGRSAMVQVLAALEFPTVRSYTTATAGGGGPSTVSQNLTGSAIYNPTRGGVDFSANPAITRGGVAGRVFLDANGNGQMDSNEQPLPDVRVVVGPIFAFTDSAGMYHAWDVMAFEPMPITVDSMTLASPLWVPAFARAVVEPAPNRYSRVDIPILPGGTIEGRVTLPTGAPASGGIVLVMRHRESGERRLLTTFGDGGFYAIGVRPGEWALSVDTKCLEALGLISAAPVTFTMLAEAEGAAVEGLEVRLSQ